MAAGEITDEPDGDVDGDVDVDRRPGRPRDVRVDAAIEAATIDELCERGFGGASIEGIAARAGVGKAAIYRRFANREALLYTVAVQFTGQCQVPDTGSLRGDLLGAWDSLSERFVGTISGRMLSDLLAEATRNPPLLEMVRGDMHGRRAPVLAAVERAQARGELVDGVDPERVVDAICGPFFYRTVFQTGDLDRPMGERVVDLVVRGVLAR